MSRVSDEILEGLIAGNRVPVWNESASMARELRAARKVVVAANRFDAGVFFLAEQFLKEPGDIVKRLQAINAMNERIPALRNALAELDALEEGK